MNTIKERMIIMMNIDIKNNKGMVIPVSDIALLPGMTYTLKLNKISEEELNNLAEEHEINIALPLKQNFNQSLIREDDFYKIGVSFHVDKIEKIEKGAPKNSQNSPSEGVR